MLMIHDAAGPEGNYPALAILDSARDLSLEAIEKLTEMK